ncbi:MAG: tRNA lysidine(34) synthetase TilS [Pseudomonadota bacterium]
MLKPSEVAELSASRLLNSGPINLSEVERLVLAVSGGSDSTALLHLAHDYWVHELGRDVAEFCAVTVNHGVRPEALAEAKEVARQCAALGVIHHHVGWDGRAVTSGFLQAARLARYEKLSAVAKSFGRAVVATGHTFDDQLETLTMRAERRADGPGMAGIAPATLFERETWFVRPLLHVHRRSLRAELSERGIGWFDDPSNFDEKFERVRVRRAGFDDPTAHAQTATVEASKRVDDAQQAALWIKEHVGVSKAATGAYAACVTVEGLSKDAVLLGMSFLCMLIGMQSERPNMDKVRRALETCGQRNGASFTLAGCQLRRVSDHIHLEPEPRNGRQTGFAFDHLLPIWEYPVLRAIDGLRDQGSVPVPRFGRFH